MDIEGVDGTLLSDTLPSIGLGESAVGRAKVWFRKKKWTCVHERVTSHDHGVGPGVNTTLLSDTL